MKARFLAMSVVCSFITVCVTSSRAEDSLSLAASSLVEKARQGAVVAQVKAALMDRKDIRSRYIRVRYDGKTIHLAGFVRDKEQGELVEEIAKRQDENATVTSFWSYEQDLEERDPYKTRVGEQAADAETWVRVRVSLRSPAAQGMLENVDVQTVDVRRGKVRVFVILDGPPEDVDITPHVKSISGVTEVEVLKVKAYKPSSAPEGQRATNNTARNSVC
jgi:osmotically-inducible protein OsmY